ncbi:MAG: FHA domain-containing protein [Xanthomonadales bacterium]|jgi:hypothetical protein|nr:FHA domain-containing protein [Xanthomonadales bacterium]
MTTYRLKGTSGAVLNQSFPLSGEQQLGPGAGNDITVEGEGDAAWASVTVRDDGSVRLIALGSEEVTVNGEAVREVSLAGGDEVRVGRSRFILQAPGLRPERVLTEEATQARGSAWAWWLAAAVLAASAAGLAWWQGWIPSLGGN